MRAFPLSSIHATQNRKLHVFNNNKYFKVSTNKSKHIILTLLYLCSVDVRRFAMSVKQF